MGYEVGKRFFDAFNCRYITIKERCTGSVYLCKVREMGMDGEFHGKGTSLFTKVELQHFTEL